MSGRPPRIIAGRFKGAVLDYPPGGSLRPTSERVRESLFSSLAADLPGAVVADLFAGTGALGLEALSRGAERVVLVESNPQARQAIANTVEKVGARERTVIIAGQVEAQWPEVAERWGPFDLILLDPPYDYANWPDLLRVLLEDCRGTHAGTWVVAEHSRRRSLDAPQAPVRTKVLGETQLSWYQPRCGEEESDV